jgi:hypothetical protein
MKILSTFSTPDLSTRVLLYDEDTDEVLWKRQYPCPTTDMVEPKHLTRTGVVLYALAQAMPSVSAVLRRSIDDLVIEVQSRTLVNLLWWGEQSDRYNSLLKPLLAKSLSTIPCSVEVSYVKNTRSRKPFPQKTPVYQEAELLSPTMAFAGM